MDVNVDIFSLDKWGNPDRISVQSIYWTCSFIRFRSSPAVPKYIQDNFKKILELTAKLLETCSQNSAMAFFVGVGIAAFIGALMYRFNQSKYSKEIQVMTIRL